MHLLRLLFWHYWHLFMLIAIGIHIFAHVLYIHLQSGQCHYAGVCVLQGEVGVVDRVPRLRQ